MPEMQRYIDVKNNFKWDFSTKKDDTLSNKTMSDLSDEIFLRWRKFYPMKKFQG